MFSTYPDLIMGIQTGGVLTPVTVKAKASGTYFEALDMATKTYVAVSTSGVSINVTDHLIIKNMVMLLNSGGLCTVYLKDGTSVTTNAYDSDPFVPGFNRDTYGVWSIEFLLVNNGITAEDIDYILLLPMKD